MNASEDYKFAATSPVGRHWLIHGVGFSVCGRDGRRLGTVEEVMVDPVRNRAASVVVRRPGLVRRPRHVTIDARAVDSVRPAARLFLVATPAEAAPPAARAPAAERARGVADSARAAALTLVGASRPRVEALDRRLAAAVVSILHGSRRGASAAAEAASRTVGRVRREAPRLGAWLSTRAREIHVGALIVLRFLRATAGGAARVLGELVVLTAVVVVSAWRRAVALAHEARRPAERGAGADEWRRDVDAPIARERIGASVRPAPPRSIDEARPDRRSRR